MEPHAGPTPGCAALVLAAGASTRLGQPKQLVCYQGEPLLRRAVRLALGAGAGPVLAAVGAEAADCRAALSGLAVTVIENRDYASGMGSSLRAGLAELRELLPAPERLLLLVCDQPLLQPEHLRQLLAAQPAGGIAAAQYNGHLGVPAVFAQTHFAALAAIQGDQGARSLLRSLAVTPVPMPEAAIDIDTPGDLAALPALASEGEKAPNP